MDAGRILAFFALFEGAVCHGPGGLEGAAFAYGRFLVKLAD